MKRTGFVAGVVLVLGCAASACGGSNAQGSAAGNEGAGGSGAATASTSAGGEAAHHGEAGGEHHGAGGERRGHGLPAGPANDFHEVLAPLWHSEDNPERTARTCTQAPTLRRHATALVDAPAPEQAQARADAWRAAATALRDSLGPLETECATTERRAVPARLADVHTAFHHLIENLEHH